jgi:hypothetical protein
MLHYSKCILFDPEIYKINFVGVDIVVVVVVFVVVVVVVVVIFVDGYIFWTNLINFIKQSNIISDQFTKHNNFII